jgi:hypothetical protein
MGYSLYFDHVFHLSLAEGVVQLGLSACNPCGYHAVEVRAVGLCGEEVL